MTASTKVRFGYLVASIALLAGPLACGGGAKLPAVKGVDPAAQVEDGRMALGEMRLSPSVCSGVDLKPETAALDERALAAFLKARGLPVRVERARADLSYVEVQVDPDTDAWARLRVAMLSSAPAAGRELHEALLQHGAGAWGIHRSNVAVLAPAGSVSDIVAFAAKTKLACWGVLTIAGRDDAYVVPGGYREL